MKNVMRCRCFEALVRGRVQSKKQTDTWPVLGTHTNKKTCSNSKSEKLHITGFHAHKYCFYNPSISEDKKAPTSLFKPQ